ncbi:hypothetical protein [Bacteriovorax sp. DB6_IX]|uniref:hypothetical protein n=1 Tax=Bacteriovorax sp. DB6_IX TaxID=1353530 RepID=UPI0004016050|nr:hypothetical protein [Bacteriovorax sp. DB6_IX]
MKPLLCILLISVFFSSCSHTVFTGKGRVPVEIHSKSVSGKVKIIYEVEQESLLWGLMPKRRYFDMGDLLFRDRVSAVGNLTITHYQSPMDQFWTYLSLGLYIPSRTRIEGWGSKVINDFE